jgi:hypothetical protein
LDTPDTPKIIKLFFDSELTTHSVPSSEPAAAMVGFFPFRFCGFWAYQAYPRIPLQPWLIAATMY